MNLRTFAVSSVIIHDIPIRRPGHPIPDLVLSDLVSPLTSELRNFFAERIIHSLARGFDVIFDETSSSPVPELVTNALSSPPPDFVQTSRAMALHLFNIQSGVNSPGLLTVVDGHIDEKACLVILKLEREQGLRIQQERNTEGERTFTLEHLRELMLTEGTRIFKAALFQNDGDDNVEIAGLVSDQQRGYLPQVEVANFFLTNFLGCALTEVASIATKKFFQTAQVYINDNIEDVSEKKKTEIALLTEMNSNNTQVDPRVFARNYLSVQHQAKFIEHLGREGVLIAPFDKDVELIANQIRSMVMEFNNGLSVSGTTHQMQSLEFREDGEGRSEAVIRDTLKTIHGR